MDLGKSILISQVRALGQLYGDAPGLNLLHCKSELDSFPQAL